MNLVDKVMMQHDKIVDQSAVSSLLSSVQQNLSNLLNSRQGMIGHLPDFGLPDVGDILNDLPHSMHELTRVIYHSVVTYEPRLTQVHISPVSTWQEQSLRLSIRGKLQAGDMVVVDTCISKNGAVKIMGID